MHKIKLRKKHVDQEYLVLEQKCSELQWLRLKKIQEKNQLKKTVSKCNTYFVCIFTHSHSIVDGGFPEISYTTLETREISFMMRLET